MEKRNLHFLIDGLKMKFLLTFFQERKNYMKLEKLKKLKFQLCVYFWKNLILYIIVNSGSYIQKWKNTIFKNFICICYLKWITRYILRKLLYENADFLKD